MYNQLQRNDSNFRWDLQKSRFLLMKPEIELDQQLQQPQDEMILGKPCKFYPLLEHSQYTFHKSGRGFIINLRHSFHRFIKLCSRLPYPNKGRYYNKFKVQSLSKNELIVGLTNHCNSEYREGKKEFYLNFVTSALEYNGTYVQPFKSLIHPKSIIQLTIDMTSQIFICIIDSQQRVFTRMAAFNFELQSAYLFLAFKNKQTSLYFTNMITS